ncbi:unnamed protein product [Orchesella dallaii]|uniref:Uncharacterized protein n=1 Tax=Orchesella dallaii TaxID=48710 RepID=A0ABP1RU71_9HEXA
MSNLLEEDSDTRSSEIDDLENDGESVDTDSLHLEEMEEEETSAMTLECNPSERVIGGSIIVQIDQTGRNRAHNARNNPLGFPILQTPFEDLTQPNISNNSCGDNHPSSILSSLPEDEPSHYHTLSASTSLSEAASDNMSTRAVLGDTPSAVNTIPGEDDIDNSSQTSMADADAERVRRIHNSIFRGLEHDLAELVRIREETIQFLENGTQANDTNENTDFDDEAPTLSQNGVQSHSHCISNFDDNNNIVERNTFTSTEDRPEPILIRERLTLPISPYRNIGAKGSLVKSPANSDANKNPNTITFNGYSYTPIAKFDNAPPAKPGKPYVEVGLMNCDEKASAARKIFDKLQYGDPEDESACFVRRFWRETSTVVENNPQEDPATIDAATLAQRSASLQATLEEAFGGLRMRLQQAQAEASANLQSLQGDNNVQSGDDGGNVGESEANQEARVENGPENLSSESNQTGNIPAAQSLSYYEGWDEETSILNNPLNYDIWNELENSNDVGTTITARINLAERRTLTNMPGSSRSFLNRPPINDSLVRTTTVAVGTDDANAHDGDLEDEMDEEISSYFRCQMTNGLSNSRGRCNESNHSNLERDFSPSTMEFFEGIGVSEQLGRDIFDMLSLSDEDVPPLIPGNSCAENNSQTPEPLYRRHRRTNSANISDLGNELEDDDDDDDLQIDFPMNSGSDGDEEDEEDGESNSVMPRVPLADTTSGSGCSLFAPNRNPRRFIHA